MSTVVDKVGSHSHTGKGSGHKRKLDDDAISSRDKIANAMKTIIEAIGEDVDREGLERTPMRAAKAMLFFTQGYNKTLVDVIGEGVFECESNNHHPKKRASIGENQQDSGTIVNGTTCAGCGATAGQQCTCDDTADAASTTDNNSVTTTSQVYSGVLGLGNVSASGIVLVRNIDIYSLCEHHMVPFFGKVHIAYVPDKLIIGLSKLARIADLFARRLQVQERLTQQIADALMEAVAPKGVAVVVEAEHMCMRMRGVEKTGASTITVCYKGLFEQAPTLRQEFMTLLVQQQQQQGR